MTDKARILFVDDEKRVLNAMRGLFRRDYELYLTTEGSEAVRLAAEHDIDVIVADQRMPGMTGIEVLGNVKQQSPRTVRILLTGYADPSAVEGSINIGEVFRFLSKPCPPQTLKETLALAIDAARTSSGVSTEPAVEPPPVTVTDEDETQPAFPALEAPPPESSQWESVTNVVMSTETAEETHSNAVSGATHAAMNDVGVVVFTIDSEFAATVIRAMPADRNTVVATTLIKVAEAVEKQNAGVLITDFTTNKVTLQRIIGVLKKHRPELITIAVSDGHDTTDMINLINYGQVFRYVLKPLEPAALAKDINAAVIRHLYLLNNPEAMKRHEVVDSPDENEATGTFSRFVGRIRRVQPHPGDPSTTR